MSPLDHTWLRWWGDPQWAPGASRLGLVMPETSIMWSEVWGFEPWNISPFSKGGRGLENEFSYMANDSISYAYLMKAHLKVWTPELSSASWLVNISGRVTYPDFSRRGHRRSVFGMSPEPALCLFIRLVLICVLYNKTVTVPFMIH